MTEEGRDALPLSQPFEIPSDFLSFFILLFPQNSS
jgi:hypothetical protein